MKLVPSIDGNTLRLCILCMVAVSTFFPIGLNGASRRAVADVAALRRELADVRATSASNTAVVVNALRDFREHYSAPGAAGAVPDGAASVAHPARDTVPVLQGNYFAASAGIGACVRGNSYFVGDASPWGVLDDAFPGGCVFDGRVYALEKPRAEKVDNE